MANNNKRNKTKKKKVVLVFDEKKRKEYLTGFSKRKNERRRRAQEELNVQVKEENKRIREEAKETTKKMKQSYQAIPELDEILKEKEYDTEDVSVKIVELSTIDMAKQNNWIGANIPSTTVLSESEPEREYSDESEEETTIPGMEISKKKKKNKPQKMNESKSTKRDDGTDEDNEDIAPKSKKELNRIIQKQTLSSMKHSKILQVKRKLDRLKDKKNFRKQVNIKQKFQKDKNKRKPQHGRDDESSSAMGRNKKSPRFHNSKDRRKHR